MSDVVAISGSPANPSRTFGVLQYLQELIEKEGLTFSLISVRDLPAEDLLWGRYNSPAVLSANEQVHQAKGVIIATPVYKTAYTGVLKTYLDLLPQSSLSGKVVLPIATGGTLAHLLSIDYSLKPVISALGSRHILGGVYIVDKQVHWQEGERLRLDPDADQRLQEAVKDLVEIVRSSSAPENLRLVSA